ncbi:MAG: helix-turn-helix transcriptional regulator [Chloroflexi bacterium]|nr:helix-turn-helix transcriptional regulator [Chloroflexota bacterium]
MKTFAETLAALMDVRHWSPSQLARHSGISRNYINKLLRGARVDPGLSVLASLAQALDVSIDELAGRPTHPSNDLAGDERALLSWFRQIRDPLIREFVLDVAHRSAEQAGSRS